MSERVRYILAGHGIGSEDFIKIDELGTFLRIEGDCVIVQFDGHDFPTKLPRTAVEGITKLRGTHE